MKKPLAVGATALALLLSFGLVACGSDDSGDNNSGDKKEQPSGEALGKAQLIEQADEICTETKSEFTAKVEENLDESSTQEDGIAFISDEVVPLYQAEIDQLRELKPDPAIADDYDEMLKTLQSELGAVEKDPEMVFENSEGTAFPEAAKLAKKFGFKVCGSGS